MRPLKIRKLQTQNFRNLDDSIISFSSGINCILGENGNGKTNILEAIYLLITRKSFRKNARFPQYLGIDGENPEIYLSAAFEEDRQLIPYSGKLWKERAEWYLKGKPTKKKLPVGVIFIDPFDGQKFYASASGRRHWFDTHLSQLNPTYAKNLSRYQAGLRQRNSLLSHKPVEFRQQISALDSDMAPIAVELTACRKQFLKELEVFAEKIFGELFDEKHKLGLGLNGQMINADVQEYLQMLAKNLPRDEMAGHSKCGVHRDDYTVFFDGMNSFDYCSLGQQKMAYLGLLFAYIELFRYRLISSPIVLMDDISGELDSLRWSRLVNYLRRKSFQVLITTANEKFGEELSRIEGANRIFIQLGSASQG